MALTPYLPFFILFPLLGLLLAALVPARREDIISRVAFAILGLQGAAGVAFLALWLWQGMPTLALPEIELFHKAGYAYWLDLHFDKITAVFLLIGSLLTFLVAVYSRYYLHREAGYKRFFLTILLFYTGYAGAIFAGNLETLIVAWEVLGISSFLLIAFYRERYLPVRNAVKIYSIYRLGDIGLILAMWLTHHVFHANVSFAQLPVRMAAHPELGWGGVALALTLLVAALGKSAQLPFSAWLPRAMEGPTPSSAIFYGALSVHMGVFLLLRTQPLWMQETGIRWTMALIGLATALVASGIGRVQSAIKAQFAYASIAQIGLMFIEIALGWTDLALLHFAGHACLRTYQLLVSPSAVAYLIREQFYDASSAGRSPESYYPKWLAYSLYVWSIQEGHLDDWLRRGLWQPLKWVGNRLGFITVQRVFTFILPLLALAVLLFAFEDSLPRSLHHVLPALFAGMGLLLVLKAFTKRVHARVSFLLVMLNHAWIAIAVSFNEHFQPVEAVFYLSGVIGAGALGLWVLSRLKRLEPEVTLNQFHGYVQQYPRLAFLFLLACLGVAGFPITTTFIGEDLVFSHIHADQQVLALLVALSYIVDGLALIRVYARVFLGPNAKSPYDVAYRSA